MPEYLFNVEGVICLSCSTPIDNALKEKDSQIFIAWDYGSSSSRIAIETQNLSAQEIVEIIDPLGFTCTEILEKKKPEQPSLEASFEPTTDPNIILFVQNLLNTLKDNPFPIETSKPLNIVEVSESSAADKTIRQHWIKGIIGIFFGLTILILTIVLATILPPLALYIITGFSVLLTFIIGKDSFLDAFRMLFKAKTLTMDSQFTVSSLVAMGVSIAALFVSWLPQMLSAGLLMFGFRHIGKAIEETAKKKMQKAFTFRERVKPTVRRLKLKSNGVIDDELNPTNLKNHFEICLIGDLKPGDIIVVEPGDIIPTDGQCLNESSIMESLINGSPVPVSKKPNEPVWSGTEVVGVPIAIKITAREQDSYLAKLDKNLNNTFTFPPAQIEKIVATILKIFIPSIFIIAIVASVVIGFFFPPALAIHVGLIILVSACPCVFGLIIPLAMKAGIAKAAEHGAIFKSHDAVEKASEIDTVVFDLNGTLTTGKPEVQACTIVDQKISEHELYSILYHLEKNQEHPIAKAIFQFVNQKPRDNAFLPPLKENIENFPNGIKATINIPDERCNHTYTVGNQSLMETLNIKIPLPTPDSQHLIFVAKNNEIVAVLGIEDPLRSDALTVVKALQKQGKEVRICTGAAPQTAMRYAQQLNIPQNLVQANRVGLELKENSTVFQTKSDYIKELQEKGRKVAAIGDGGNDATFLKQSNLGFAIQSPTAHEVTLSNADITLHSGALRPILAAFEIAEQTLSHIKRSLLLNLGYNVGAIALFAILPMVLGIAINPAVGVAVMFLQTFILLGLTYYLNKSKLKSESIPLEEISQESGSFIENESTKIETSKKQATLEPKPSETPPCRGVNTSFVAPGIGSFFWLPNTTVKNPTPKKHESISCNNR